jgi:hypothetical protein
VKCILLGFGSAEPICIDEYRRISFGHLQNLTEAEHATGAMAHVVGKYM